jgi:hypothetical protein
MSRLGRCAYVAPKGVLGGRHRLQVGRINTHRVTAKVIELLARPDLLVEK